MTDAKVAARTRLNSILIGKIGNNLVWLPRPVNQVSQRANDIHKNIELTMRKMINRLPQGYFWPPSSRGTMAVMAAPRDKNTPTMSISRRLDEVNFPVELGKTRKTNIMMNAPHGTLIQNTHYSISVSMELREMKLGGPARHVVCVVMTPPSTGPRTLEQALAKLNAPETWPMSLKGTTSKADAYESA